MLVAVAILTYSSLVYFAERDGGQVAGFMMMITVIALDHWDDNDNGFDDGSDHNGDGCCGSVPPFFNFFQAIDPGTICQLRSETWKNHHLFKHNLNSPWKKHVAGNCFMWKLSFRHEFIIKPVWASTSPPLDLCRGLLVPKYISTHRSCLGLIWPWFLDAIASSRCYPCEWVSEWVSQSVSQWVSEW